MFLRVVVLVDKEDILFTVGQFASKAGVTERTIRFYDNIGLLKPCSRNTSGHRLYSAQDFAKLQKILTLKFIGLSLEDITSIMRYDINDNNFKKSLKVQKDIIEKKIQHMHMVTDTIDETLHMLDNDNVLNWDKFINIISIINIDKNWMEQYENATNLRHRINIHDLYSTNKYGWMQWFFEQLEGPSNASVLEVGCGDGSLWVKNIHRVPENWEITLTDFSSGMLKDAKKSLSGNLLKVKFKIVDVQSIPFKDSSFDIVIANHMLFHVPDIDRALSEIFRVLKPHGHIFASTVGENHMAELNNIVEKFAHEEVNNKMWKHTEKFQLENGIAQVSKWFGNVELKRYDDSLIVTDAAPLVDYILSKPGNFQQIFRGEKLEQLTEYLNMEIKNNGGIHIIKDTGFFLGEKCI